MNFSTFEKVSSGNLIYFKNAIPIENAGSLKFYKDNASGTFLKKEMRWSFDREHWANWEDLNVGSIAKINTGDNRYLFFEIKYTQSNAQSKVSTFSIEYLPATGKTYVPTDNIHPDNNHTLPAGCNDIGGTTKTYETIKITDAETLCGKSCDYYLWRPNHKGTQGITTIDGLQNILNNLNAGVADSINNALNVDGSGVGTFFQKSGKNLIFKRINPGPGAYIVEDPSGIITIGVDASLSIHDPSINDLYNLISQLNTNITDISIYIDYKFLSIDSSLADLYAKDASSLKTGINLGGGVGEVFKGIVGQQIQFRTIVSKTGAITIELNPLNLDQIQIGFDASVSGETTWTDLDPISADVGGWVGGNDVSFGANSIEILEKMLYEYFPPKISLNLAPSPGYYEKWIPSSLSDVSVYGSFNNENFTKVRITDVSAYATLLGGFGHTSYPDVSTGNFSFNDGGFNSNWDDIVYTIKVYNKVGGNMMPTADASAEIKFVLPYIWGVINTPGAIDASTLQYFHSIAQKKIIPEQSNEIEFIRPSGITKARFIYAYPDSYADLKNIFDIRNDFNVTSSFDAPITININLGVQTNIPYKVYVKSHWIDVSSFKLIFNI